MDESGCARFELLTNGTGGRWDGVLTISPQWKNSEMKIQLEFDEFSFALGVSGSPKSINVIKTNLFNFILI